MNQALQIDSDISMHRQRLLDGMARAVAAKGYGETTIADIVREASVSRRTFYEHFSTKADCLIALYEAASYSALKVLRDAIDPSRDWHDQVEQAMKAYLGCLAQNPVLIRTLFMEIVGLGAPGFAARRRANDQIVAFMLKIINGQRGAGNPPLSTEMALAIVGAIHELVLLAIEQDRVSKLDELVGPSVQLVRAIA